MSDDQDLWKWDKFVEIGDKIHMMKGVNRTEAAQNALLFAKVLRRTEFVFGSKERFERYETLLFKLTEYLDGNAEAIQTAVREYFLVHHVKSGLDQYQFDFSFSPKKSGIQAGFTCKVVNGSLSTRYFIKTHQYGPTEDEIKSSKPPDTKEIFVYTLLHHIGIGPEAHFIIPLHGTKSTVYIATKDCKLVLLSNLTKESANTKALLQVDLISRVLCLEDCTDNYSNFGQVGDKPMIVDFRIKKKSGGYVKSDILEGFCEGTGKRHYSQVMAAATGIPKENKLIIIEESLKEWKLLENIDKTVLEVNELIRKCGDKLTSENDLQRYAQDIKVNAEILNKT